MSCQSFEDVDVGHRCRWLYTSFAQLSIPSRASPFWLSPKIEVDVNELFFSLLSAYISLFSVDFWLFIFGLLEFKNLFSSSLNWHLSIFRFFISSRAYLTLLISTNVDRTRCFILLFRERREREFNFNSCFYDVWRFDAAADIVSLWLWYVQTSSCQFILNETWQTLIKIQIRKFHTLCRKFAASHADFVV